MAECLVKAIDATHPDPAVDRMGCYKRGDIVVVMPDGWEWGKEEGPPIFYVIKVPGISAEEAIQFSKHGKDRRRDHHIDLTNLHHGATGHRGLIKAK